MRAMVCRSWDGMDGLSLGELPEPQPKPDEVVIAVRASGVNYADTLMVQGKYQTKPEHPFAPGLEAAGTILRCGDKVTKFKPGDRVMAMLYCGGFAEQAVAREVDTQLIPDGMDFATAGSFLIAYVSSHVAIRWQGRLQAGETMLVLGAAGGVGLTAVEIGKAMGARVIAAASSADKLALTREHGADATVNYSEAKLKDAVMALTDGRGVDVVYDPVGGALFDDALSSLDWGGRILLIGFVGGIPQIPANRLLVKHRAALGSSLRYFRYHKPDQLRTSMAELAEWHKAGKLQPLVSDRFPLERAVDAMRVLTERRAKGKVVVEVND